MRTAASQAARWIAGGDCLLGNDCYRSHPNCQSKHSVRLLPLLAAMLNPLLPRLGARPARSAECRHGSQHCQAPCRRQDCSRQDGGEQPPAAGVGQVVGRAIDVAAQRVAAVSLP
jgi:hypothetical protein